MPPPQHPPLVGNKMMQLFFCFVIICLAVGSIQTGPLQVSAAPSCNCNDAAPVGAEVKIGILAFCYQHERGIVAGGASSCGVDTSVNAVASLMSKLTQDAQQLYIDLMMAAQPMPLTNGNSTSFDFTWINLQSIDWSTGAGFELLYPDAQELFQNITQTTMYGGPYPIIILPPFIPTDLVVLLMNFCENQPGNHCVVIHPFNYELNHNICGTDPGSLADCGARGRLVGQRRWDNMLGVMFDSTWNANAAMDMYRMKDVKSTIVIHDHFTDWGPKAAKVAYDSARQLNIQVYGPIDPVDCVSGCVVDRLTGGTTNGFPEGRNAQQMAEYIKQLNPDSITLMTGQTRTPSTQTFADMFAHLRKIDWTPKAIFIGGGGMAALLKYLSDEDKEVLRWVWMTGPWDARLRGPMYHAVNTSVNYELLSSTADDDLPQLFAKAFYQKYPQWQSISLFTGSLQCFTSFGWQSLAIAQKLIETGMTTDVNALMLASTRISTASLYHWMQFDPFGRAMRVNEVLYQAMDTHDTLRLLSPVNVGSEPIYPLPTWSERIFSADKYSDPLEQMMAAITSVAIAYCLSWYVFLAKHIRHPVIRASTPSFCALIILGAVLMLMSNYFHTLVEHDSDCSAQLWLLTIGFTLIFSCLFIKTARIWKIFFGSKKLTVVKMKDSDLLVTVAAFLCADIIINAVWEGVDGMNSKFVVPDPNRKAESYYTCDYNHTALAFVYTHLAVKCGLLLFGIGLTWAVRNTPSQFNESTYIGLGIYNVSLIICFVVPILASNAAGRDSYLIRAFAIIFVACSTITLLYVPKWTSIRRYTGNGGLTGGGTSVLDKGMTMTSGSGYTPSKDLEMTRKSTHPHGSKALGGTSGHGTNNVMKSSSDGNPPLLPQGSHSSAQSSGNHAPQADERRTLSASPHSSLSVDRERNGRSSVDTVVTLTNAGSNAHLPGSAPTSPGIPEAGAAYAVPGAVVHEDDV